MMSHPVFWSQTRAAGNQFMETDPVYGKVYHIGSAAEELDMLRRENGLMWQAHPRTKGSTGYPDAVREWPHFLSERSLGASFQSLPVDQSEKRICEKRCLGLLDDMNNWTANPKYLIAEGDTYMKYPDDETFPQLYVNYVKLDSVPEFDEDWSPILAAMRAGKFYVSAAKCCCGAGASRGPAPAALTPRKWNGRSRWNLSSWSGAMAIPRTRK